VTGEKEGEKEDGWGTISNRSVKRGSRKGGKKKISPKGGRRGKKVFEKLKGLNGKKGGEEKKTPQSW